jgi:uncharacterized membrane protein
LPTATAISGRLLAMGSTIATVAAVHGLLTYGPSSAEVIPLLIPMSP